MNKYAGKVTIKSEIVRVVSSSKVALTAKCIIGLVNIDLDRTQVSQAMTYIHVNTKYQVNKYKDKGVVYYSFGNDVTGKAKKKRPVKKFVDIVTKPVNLTHMLFSGRCMEAVTLHKAIVGAHL